MLTGITDSMVATSWAANATRSASVLPPPLRPASLPFAPFASRFTLPICGPCICGPWNWGLEMLMPPGPKPCAETSSTVCEKLFGLGLALGLLAVHAHAPTPVPHLCAALAGFALPQAGSMVRARWTHNAEPSMIQTAFALEAVLDEVVFIVGPVVVTFLATLINPYVGLTVAGVAGVSGSLLLAAQRRTEPPSRRRRDDPSSGRGRLPFGLLAPLLLAGVGFGVLFGGAELVTVAVAEDRGHKELSGVLLAIWAAGSLIAGLLVGARPPQMSSLTQLRIATVVLTLSFVPLLLISALPLVAVALFVSGFAIAPSMVACTRIVEQGVPRERLTEGIAWFTTGLATGVAPGAAVSGWVVDSTSPSWGYLVCLLAGFLAVAGAWGVRVGAPVPASDTPAEATEAGR